MVHLAMMPPPPNLLLALLLAGGCSTILGTHAFPANASSYLNIHMPFSLHKDNDGAGYQHRTAHFGRDLFLSSPYGSMALNVHLLTEADGNFDLCEWPLPAAPVDNNKSSGAGTGGAGNFVPPRRGIAPFMLLADRGNCSFTTKARHAQMAGAAALLLADTTCLCSNAACVGNQTAADPPCQSSEPSVADDGSGGDVSIPSFLLHKTDSDRIKETLRKNTPVLVDVRWHPPLHVDSLNYSAWVDPLDNRTKQLLRDWSPVALALGSKAFFVPHFTLYNGSLTNCPGNTGSDACYGTCTNNGRYCYPSHKIPGSKVVTEILRRLCIWKYHGNDDGIGEAWYKYVTTFDERCSNANETYADDKCIGDAYAAAGVSVTDVTECMNDSGGTDGDTPNNLLDQELTSAAEYGIVASPTVYVNREKMRSPSSSPLAKSTLEAICTGYVDGSQPELCVRCAGSDDVVACATKEGPAPAPTPPSGSTTKKGHFWRNTFLILAVLGGAGFVYYKKFMGDDGTVPDSYRSLRYAMLGDQDAD